MFWAHKKIGKFGLEHKPRSDKMAAACALSALLASPLWLLFVFLLGSFPVADQQTVSMLDMYTSYGKDTTTVIQLISHPSFLSFARLTISASWWETNVSAGSTALWCGRLPCGVVDCPMMRKVFDRLKRSPCLGIYIQTYNLGHKGWEISLYTRFAPPYPCAMLTKHFDLTQICIKLFSNIERENGGAGTYSIGITVRSTYFYHFPKQFFHGCQNFLIF